MPTVKFLESGTDATQDFSFFASTSNNANATIASDSTQSFTGPRSIKVANTATPGFARCITPAGLTSDAGTAISYRVRFSTVAPSAHQAFTFIRSGAGFNVFAIGLDTAGVLRIGGAGCTSSAGTTALSASTWYRLTLTWLITSSTSWSCKLYINGRLEITITNSSGTLTNVSTGPVAFGTNDDAGTFDGNLANTSAIITVWFDDIYFDDRTDLTDPGEIRVTAKLPASENVTSFDTAIGAARSAADYNSVNQRPLSETNGWQQAATSQVSENYGIQGVATGDVNITGKALVGYSGWVWAKVAAISGSPTAAIILNGNNISITLAITSALYVTYVTSSTYPSNAATIGLRSTGTVDDTFFYECGVLIAFTESAEMSINRTLICTPIRLG